MKYLALFFAILLPLTLHAEEFNVISDSEVPAYAAKSNPNAITPIDEEDDVYLNDHQKITPKVLHEANEELHYTLDITYPQISGTDLSDHAQEFNRRMQDMVKVSAEQFKKSVKDDAPHMLTLPKEVQKNYLTIDYDLDVIHPDNEEVVSVRLSLESMQAGRAHPYHAHQVLNYDLARGKPLELRDLFKTDADFLKFMSKYSEQKLNADLKDKWMIANGTKPNVKNYKNWNMEEDAILITFDEYQVAPYSNGPQEIEIPYSELNSILSNRSPLISSIKKAEQVG